jgi:hypothetical protein
MGEGGERMSKFNVGDTVEVAKRGYAVKRGTICTVQKVIPAWFPIYEVINHSGDKDMILEEHLNEFKAGIDDPKLIKIMEELRINPETDEEDRKLQRLFKILTSDRGQDPFFVMMTLYAYGKTQGVKKERLRKARTGNFLDCRV